MPAILVILGWRFFFYANEGTSRFTSIAGREAARPNIGSDVDVFEAIEAHAYNMSPADKKTVRRIIFEHFYYIVSEWHKFQEQKNG